MGETNQAVAAVEAKVQTIKSKVIAFVKAHVPTVIAASAGYGAGSFGLVSKLLKLFS